MHRATPPALVVWILVSALGLAACGSAGSSTPVSTPSPVNPSPVQTAEATTGASDSDLVEIATDNKFTPASYSVDAGKTYTLRLDNRGAAIHNWHILGVKGADGKDIIGAVVDPGKSGTLKFSVSQPGTYRFLCDVHPDDMRGTLTVR